VVDNAIDGFTLYRLAGDEEPVRTFVTPPPSVSVPKQVAFGAEGRLVVGGSDNGSVYIFERKTGKLLETLRHSNAGLVQTIAVGVESLWRIDVDCVSRHAISTAVAWSSVHHQH
jgi:outer membrane protein assembly factor BamB